jgi:hypothetical protein
MEKEWYLAREEFRKKRKILSIFSLSFDNYSETQSSRGKSPKLLSISLLAIFLI